MALIVVTGPPAAGKSTWVLERATPTDIVIDFDRLATALTGHGADSHNHAGPVHAVTRKARQAAIDAALTHADTIDVYVIHSTPGAARLAHYRDHGARIITIDPGRDVTMARCTRERPKRMRIAAARWYEQPAPGAVEATPGTASRAW